MIFDLLTPASPVVDSLVAFQNDFVGSASLVVSEFAFEFVVVFVAAVVVAADDDAAVVAVVVVVVVEEVVEEVVVGAVAAVVAVSVFVRRAVERYQYQENGPFAYLGRVILPGPVILVAGPVFAG